MNLYFTNDRLGYTLWIGSPTWSEDGFFKGDNNVEPLLEWKKQPKYVHADIGISIQRGELIKINLVRGPFINRRKSKASKKEGDLK